MTGPGRRVTGRRTNCIDIEGPKHHDYPPVPVDYVSGTKPPPRVLVSREKEDPTTIPSWKKGSVLEKTGVEDVIRIKSLVEETHQEREGVLVTDEVCWCRTRGCVGDGNRTDSTGGKSLLPDPDWSHGDP